MKLWLCVKTILLLALFCVFLCSSAPFSSFVLQKTNFFLAIWKLHLLIDKRAACFLPWILFEVIMLDNLYVCRGSTQSKASIQLTNPTLPSHCLSESYQHWHHPNPYSWSKDHELKNTPVLANHPLQNQTLLQKMLPHHLKIMTPPSRGRMFPTITLHLHCVEHSRNETLPNISSFHTSIIFLFPGIL